MHDDDDGTWVKLEIGDAAIDLSRWPGPHGDGECIGTLRGGSFVFDRWDEGDTVAVYRWQSDS